MAPPLSPRARTRKHREKLKSDAEKYRAAKEKDRQRKREARAKERTIGRIDKVKEANQRIKNRKRVAEFRRRQKVKRLENSMENVYKNKQSLGKAVARASKLLPNSPRKKKAVITKLAENCGVVSLATSQSSQMETERRVMTSLDKPLERGTMSQFGQMMAKKDSRRGTFIFQSKRHVPYSRKSTHHYQ